MGMGKTEGCRISRGSVEMPSTEVGDAEAAAGEGEMMAK